MRCISGDSISSGSGRNPIPFATACIAPLVAILAVVLSPHPASANHRVCFTAFRILDPAPILIKCGEKRNINCSVDYERDHFNLTAGCCFVLRGGEGERSFTAQIVDDDYPWGSEAYGETKITVPAAATGTVNFTVSVSCTFE